MVVGSIDAGPRVWQDAKTGEHRGGIDVTVRDVRLLDSKQDGEQMPTSMDSVQEIPW